MPASDQSPANAGATVVSREMVVTSIAGFWAFYFAVSTVRTAMGGEHGQLSMLGPRLFVSLVSMCVTALVYLILRRVSGGTLTRSITVAMVVSLPAAVVYGGTNWVMFERVLPVLRHAAKPLAPPLAVTVENHPGSYMSMSPLVDVADTAINGYFFMVTWCALYLALSYASQVAALERRSAQLAASAQAAELRALRYQINPHFLFNTMNSLSALVMAGRNAEADHMIVGLSTFFRASLTDDPTQDVALDDEIALQRLYLEIEAVRFTDRLNVEIDVPAELGTACVPGLILQPLVENVIKHALTRSRLPVTLLITARGEEGILRLSVTDNGARIVSELNTPGVGLANVRDRMIARFGTAGSAEWRVTDQGFTVSLVMPLSHDGC